MRRRTLVVLLLGNGAALLAGTAGAPATDATSQAPRVIGQSQQVTRGGHAFLDVRVAKGSRCLLSSITGRRTVISRSVRARTGALRFSWRVPSNATPGSLPEKISCKRGSHARTMRTSAMTIVADTPGAGTLFANHHVSVASLRVAHGAKPGHGVPSGRSAPAGTRAQLTPGTGGGPFGTFWPLDSGTQATITQGQGGGDSHSTVYTRYAVDVGVPAGTEVRAGFSGVVAKTSSGCTPGDASCGGGFGNYVLLQAGDGTCGLTAHLSRVDVQPGQQVPKYQLLGLSGYTGHVYPAGPAGAHLHVDHTTCDSFHSLPWSPAEGGSLAPGSVITSQNAPDAPPPPSNPPAAAPPPPVTGTPVTPYNNYGEGAVGHAMCRGNPGNQASTPGGTATQTFIVPDGVSSLNAATVQVDPDSSVAAHLTVLVNGAAKASADAAAAGDTSFSFGPVAVAKGDTVMLSITFTATAGKIITVYTVGNPGGSFTATNTCSDGAPNVATGDTGLRATVSGVS